MDKPGRKWSMCVRRSLARPANTGCNSNDSKSMSTVPPPPPDNGGQLCWVAREVYGVNDGRWLEFRSWLLGEAPAWLRNTYVKHGAAFATWVSDKPIIKQVIRRMVDR